MLDENDHSPKSPHGQGEDNTSSIEEILAGYIDRLNRGEEIIPEEILFDHPGLGQKIIDHLQIFMHSTVSSCEDVPSHSLGTLGDYTLRRQIGRGGMGIVYEAWQNSVERHVALKVLPGAVAVDDKAFHRFMREARTAAKLSHQNIVGVYGMGQEDNTPYYSMELVDGETLARVITKTKSLDSEAETVFGPKDSAAYFDKLARAFADAADGLQHAHSKGVIHRDIKPSNLILDREDRLRILDFGLARLEGQESLTQSGDLVGTPLYMSPEQARQRKVKIDHRTDIYSLGTTLYELLAFRPTFKGKSHQDTLSQIVERDPVELQKLNPRVPKELDTIVLKCLRKDPGDRYGTSEALSQDLKRFVRGDPIEAKSQSRLETLSRRLWRYRRRIMAGLMLAVFVVVTGLFLRGLQLQEHERLRAEYHKEVRDASLIIDGYFASVTGGSGITNIIDPYGSIENDFRFFFQTSSSAAEDDSVASLATKLSRVAQVFPERPEAYYLKARALNLLGRDREALHQTKLALEKDRTFVPARFLEESLKSRTDRGRVLKAMRNVMDALEEDTWQWQWLKAHSALKGGQWAEAADDFLELYRTYKREGEPYPGAIVESLLRRGQARLESEDYNGAILDFGVADFLWPNTLIPRLLMGKAYYLNRQEEAAEEVFKNLVDEESSADSERWTVDRAFMITILYESLADYDKTCTWTTKIRDEAVREAYNADCFLNKGQTLKAEASAERAVALKPSLVIGHVLLGYALLAQEKYDRAESAFRTIINEHPENPVGYTYLGFVLCKRGDWEDGLTEFNKALDWCPDFHQALHHLGRAYVKMKRWPDAESTFNKILKNSPSSLHDRGWLAKVYVEQGRYAEAEALCRETLEKNRRYVSAHLMLGVAQLKQGQSALGIDSFCHAIDFTPSRSGVYEVIIPYLDPATKLECPGALQKLIDLVANHLVEVDLEDEEEKRCLLQGAEVVVLASQHAPSTENLERAVGLAERAVAATNRENAHILSLFATALHQRGERNEAIQVLEEACRLPTNEADKDKRLRLEERLSRWKENTHPSND